MPDYLGADQRKVRKEEEKDEKPIQGNLNLFNMILWEFIL